MKGRFLIQVFILASFSILSGKCYSCYQDPTAVISGSDPRNVCVGETENFNGTSSHDNDEGGSSIVGYQWSCPDASVDSPTASSTDITFGNSGSYTVTLTVTDDESATDNDTCQVTVVEVDKVVEYGTTDEGPLYAVCPFETVLLEAKPNPSDAEFPPYEPHWTIVSQPGSSGSLSPPSPINHVKVLSGLTEPGTYVVRAKCGDSDTGDDITVVIPPSQGYWDRFLPDFACPPWFWQNDHKTIVDHCLNEIEVSCPDDCFIWKYNQVQVGLCVWTGGNNDFWYKATIGEIHGKERLLQTMHLTQNDGKGIDAQGEGCDGYWCWRVERYDCVNETSFEGSPWWRRDPDGTGYNENQGEPCLNEGGAHPYYPN